MINKRSWMILVLFNIILFARTNQSFDNCKKIQGKNILITGASKGIGKEIALQLSKCDVSIIATGRNELDLISLKETAMSNKAKNFRTFSFDLSLKKTPEALMQIVKKHFDFVHLVFFSHAHLGGYRHYKGSQKDEDDFEYMMDVNFYSVYRITSQILKHFKNSKPKLVFFSSDLAENPKSETFAYSISKSALVAFGKILQQRPYQKKMDVTFVVIPGTDTPGLFSAIRNSFFEYNKGKSEDDLLTYYESIKENLASTKDIAHDIIEASLSGEKYINLLQKYEVKNDEL